MTYVIVGCAAYLITGISQDPTIQNIHMLIGCITAGVILANFIILLSICIFLASQHQSSAKDKHTVYSAIIPTVNLRAGFVNFVVDSLAICEIGGFVVLMACYGHSFWAAILFIVYVGVMSVRHFLKAHLRKYVLGLSPAVLYDLEGGLPSVIVRAIIDELSNSKHELNFGHFDFESTFVKFKFTEIPHIEFKLTYLDGNGTARLKFTDMRYGNETCYSEFSLEHPNSIDEIINKIKFVKDRRMLDMKPDVTDYLNTIQRYVQSV